VVLVADYETEFPSAVASSQDYLEACIAHLRMPVTHRRAIRTTNLSIDIAQDRAAAGARLSGHRVDPHPIHERHVDDAPLSRTVLPATHHPTNVGGDFILAEYLLRFEVV
jgi:hypothetical protein